LYLLGLGRLLIYSSRYLNQETAKGRFQQGKLLPVTTSLTTQR